MRFARSISASPSTVRILVRFNVVGPLIQSYLTLGTLLGYLASALPFLEPHDLNDSGLGKFLGSGVLLRGSLVTFCIRKER